MIHVACPGCAKKLVVEDRRAGMVAKCLNCGNKIRIPGAKVAVPSAGRADSGTGSPAVRTPPAPPKSTPPSAPPKPPRPVSPPHRDSFDQLEVVDDPLEVVEEDRTPPRKPVREAITREPPPRSKPAPPPEEIEPEPDPVEEEGEEDRPARRKPKRKKKRRDSEGQSANLYLIVGGVVIFLWFGLTAGAFFSRSLATLLVLIGGVSLIISQIWVRRALREEYGPAGTILLFIPFFNVFYFIMRINRMLIPLLLWVAAAVFLVSGMITLQVHSDEFKREMASGGFVDEDDEPQGPSPLELDARLGRLLATPGAKDARLWLGEAVAHDPSLAPLRDKVERAYKNGAVKVTVVQDPEPAAEGEDVLVLVTLPPDQRARALFFIWFKREVDPAARDFGQKYLKLPMPK